MRSNIQTEPTRLSPCAMLSPRRAAHLARWADKRAGGSVFEGHIVVDSIAPIAVTDVTYDLARESGFESVDDLLRIARHGSGDKVYLIRFHYLPPGAWDTPRR